MRFKLSDRIAFDPTELVLDPVCAAVVKVPAMLSPKPGDVLIRDAVSGYTVIDAVSLRELCGPYLSIFDAVVAARGQVSTGDLWREYLDPQGRTLGAFRLDLPASFV